MRYTRAMFVQGAWIADGVARVTIGEYGQRYSRFPHDRLAGSLGLPRIEAGARLPDSGLFRAGEAGAGFPQGGRRADIPPRRMSVSGGFCRGARGITPQAA
ncbi:MAG: hypothetical protein IPK65_09945 [Gammaproteobacteria bacterium]|nr:hypothetical protein [Gammaproteobacteria bacterium]